LILTAAVATFRRWKRIALLPEDVMPSSFRWLASLVLLMLATTQVWADACFHVFGRRDPLIFQDRSAPAPEYDLVIVRDPSATEAELRIPRRMMVADAAAPASSTRTAIAGLALSAACVAGGLWCLRFRPREIPKKKLLIGFAVIAVLFAVLTLVEFSEANGPEKSIPTIRLGDIAVNVRIVDQGDAVELVVPAELADKIKAR
jgi:hypothetical protein